MLFYRQKTVDKNFGWSWTSVHCSIVRVMRIVAERLRLESRGFHYKLPPICILSLRTKFKGIPFEF